MSKSTLALRLDKDPTELRMESSWQPNAATAIKRRSWDSPRLSDDILLLVLDYLEAEPDKFIGLDKRAYLSQESFRPPPPPSPTQAKDVGTFRLVNKRFAELGAARQFARVTTRFSKKGFKRLDDIAKHEHLAKYVKKFSYMIPYFYLPGKDRVSQILPSLSSSLGELDVSHYQKKIYEQRTLVDNKEDGAVLTRAFSAFRGLKHVQILPVQDLADERLLNYLRQHEELLEFVDLRWPPACSHSMRTTVHAAILAHNNLERFSWPRTSPQSAQFLADQPPGMGPEFHKSLQVLAEGLTSIEIHFDGGFDDDQILQLSPLFKAVFYAAKNLQEVHVGFPMRRPLEIHLEDVFHHVRWEKLIAFGVQSWRLDTEQIIELVSRHKERLKGLRLRDVILTEGSRWTDVLHYLRNNLKRLEWVSLRRIDYANHFDDLMAAAGGEIPDYWLAPIDSDSDSDILQLDDGHETNHANGNLLGHHSDDESIGSESNGDHEEVSDDDHGPEGNGMEFPRLQPDTPTSQTWCSCEHNKIEREGPEELGDDGISVPNETRKRWEKWVVRSCPEHSPR